jgi:hypothetical protein
MRAGVWLAALLVAAGCSDAPTAPVYVVPSRDLVVVATTDWVQLTDITPTELAAQVLGVIVNDVVPAAH